MVVSLKYAVVERERRFLIGAIPPGPAARRTIIDRYVIGTRLRLREVRERDGSVTRKLTHKVRLGEDASEIACTNMYLDDAEWTLLQAMPARVLAKTRHLITRDGVTVAVDEFADGTLLAEIDDGDRTSPDVPTWLDVIEDVSADERWTGAALAR